MSDCKEFKGIVLVNLVRKVDFVRGVKVVKTVLLVMGVPRKFSRSVCKGLQGG